VRRALAAACVLLAACEAYAFGWDSSTGTVVIGFVTNGVAGTVVIEAPDTVRAGRAFEVTVNTVGSSSCVRAERLEVQVTDTVARLTPYDRVAPDGVPCTEDLAAHPHVASVTFPSRGTGALEVLGRSSAGDTLVRNTIVVQ
jgi:hypothetical protein